MEAAFVAEIFKYGTGGVLAVFFYFRWQKAEDRADKLRDAFDVKTAEFHQKNLDLQQKGFENHLRVEGALSNSTQALAANTATMQGLTKVLASKAGGE